MLKALVALQRLHAPCSGRLGASVRSDSLAERGEFELPARQRNQASRTREYLTPDEVERMIVAVRHAGGRLAERDALSIMMAYRHGLRASELIALRWEQIDLKAGLLHVVRLKHGSPSTHPLRGPELTCVARVEAGAGRRDALCVHVAARRPYDAAHRASRRRGSRQGGRIDFPAHPHMLRHATGFYFANAGQDTRAIQLYLGHKSIQHTVRYTELAADRFKDFWKD